MNIKKQNQHFTEYGSTCNSSPPMSLQPLWSNVLPHPKRNEPVIIRVWRGESVVLGAFVLLIRPGQGR